MSCHYLIREGVGGQKGCTPRMAGREIGQPVDATDWLWVVTGAGTVQVAGGGQVS